VEIKRRKWLVLAFIAVVLVLLAPYLLLRLSAARGVQKRLDAIRASGLPASPRELDKWYKPVAAVSNRALVIVEAAELYNATAGAGPKKAPALKPGNAVSPKVWEQLRSIVATNRAVLGLLHEAALLPESRYPIDLSLGPATLLPHLAQVKDLVGLLWMNAIYQSHQTNVPAAVQSIITAFALADSLGNEPILVSQYVRMYAVEQAVSALSWVLSEHPLSREQLADLNVKIAAAESAGREGFFRALVGERVCGISFFAMTFKDMAQLGPPGFPEGPAGLEALTFQLYRASGIRHRDFSLYLETMEHFISSAARSSPESLAEFELAERQFNEELRSGLNQFAVLSRMLLVPMGKASLKAANSAALLRCAQIALGMERFRNEHSQNFPATLDELAPTYLYKLPADPYDGSEPHCDRLPEKGYRVFMTGAAAANRSYISQNITNLTFVVRR
jgi:hypothetical protein